MASHDRASEAWNRTGALAGAAYVALTVVGNQLAAGGSSDPHPSGATDLTTLASTPGVVAQLGSAIEFLGFIAFMFYLGWLVTTLRTRGGVATWFASTAVIAGTVTVALKISSIFPVIAGRLDHNSLSPSIARVLADMNNVAFVVTFLTFGTFLAAVGAAFVVSRVMSRWFGWSAVAIGGGTIALTLLSGADPINANALPFMLGLLWILVTGIVLAWRGVRAELPGEPTRIATPA
ncbi:hypothetical protein [Rathayibacter soli]|uniref:hypothetical protein n=1 Tax=Rathayibacter soli TaxID=3144168 RepID=UPI0027E4752B|nr:hypothetical protein [Glaciibacter superstes]